MTADAWLTLAVLAAVFVALVRDLLPPSVTIGAGVIVLLVTGVVTPAEAFSGFANDAIFTIAALFVLARAVEKTGALTPLVRVVLGARTSIRRSLGRLVVSTAGVSAFLNNTPIVAMLMPQVIAWADERRESVSKYLMPLSFAALLGGAITVIGTSTNLVVNGLMSQAGLEPIGFFEITRIGLPVAVAGSLLLVALAPLLIPERRGVRQEASEEVRQFVVEMTVDRGGPLDGTAVEAGGLRHLAGVFLATVERDHELLAPVAPDTVLHGGDRLRFVGRADDIVDLQATRGLSAVATEHILDLDTVRARYSEAVIGAASPLVGRTLKEAGFRNRYQAVVMAIHRAGHLVEGKLGEIPLRVGDTLLLLADPGFRERWRDRNDFLLISGPGKTLPTTGPKAALTLLIALGIVVFAGAGLLPILNAALLGVAALILFRVLTPNEARNAIDIEVIVMIGAAFGLAAAMEASGLAATAAEALVTAFQGLGARGVLGAIVVATVVLTGMITNTAAAQLIFPVAVNAAPSVGLDPRGTAVAIAVAASVDFLTPIGYQTNTMVYGPGGYRFTDYARMGAPLTLTTIVLLVALVPVFWP